jgi:hypothetical protein
MRRLIAATALCLLCTGSLHAERCLTPTPRKAATVETFKRISKYPNGRPGHRVDHVLPLCACGEDHPRNMQWQPVAESYKKDVFERAMCAAMDKADPERVKAREQPAKTTPRAARKEP